MRDVGWKLCLFCLLLFFCTDDGGVDSEAFLCYRTGMGWYGVWGWCRSVDWND